MDRAELHAFLTQEGYNHLRMVGQRLCGLYNFMFTYGLVYGLDESGYAGRYCYENGMDALNALESWSGEGHPSGPWIKHKGHGVDELNPELAV